MKSLLLLTAFLCSPAGASDLQVTPLPGWDRISESSQGIIFQKRKSKKGETVIVQNFAAEAGDGAFERMTAVKLGAVRRRLFEVMGLRDYRILGLRDLSPLQKGVASTQILIESSYRDFTGAPVQAIERQYVVGSEFYVLTYRVSDKSIRNYNEIRRVLDTFKPKIKAGAPQRSVAGELAVPAATVKIREASSSPPAPDPIREELMAQEQIEKRCGDIPPERRRTTHDLSSETTLRVALSLSGSCLMGVAENVWDLIKGTYDILKNGLRLLFDREYRSQVKAVVGTVAAEAYRHPVEFQMRLMGALYEAARKNVGDFFECLSPAAKVEALCKMASNLIPAGFIGKILTKVPLAADEAAKLAKISAEAVRGPYVEKKISIRGVKHEKVLGDGDDTLSKVSNALDKKEIGTYTRSFSGLKSRAYSSADESGNPTLVFRKNVLKNPEENAGVIGHEATHAVNRLRAQSGQELGAARTVKFNAVGDVRLNPGLKTYKTYMRVDEIHARAVQSGIELNRAEKDLSLGRTKAAKARLEEAGRNIDDALKMQRSSRALFREAQFELTESETKRAVYDRKSGEMKVRVPMYTEKTAARLKELKVRDHAAYLKAEENVEGVDVRVQVGLGLNENEARRRAQEVLTQASQDVDRFTKTFQANKKKLEILRSRSP